MPDATYTDRHGIVWTILRADENPRWWVAVHPDGWRCPLAQPGQ